MTLRSRMVSRAGVLAFVATCAFAVPANAHPYFAGGEVPVDSLASLTLELNHGCGSEAGGEGDDTTEVALAVPEWMRIVEVPDPGGWVVTLEEGDDGRVEVVTWSTATPVEPAPSFDLDVVVEGEPGDERFLGLFQACGDAVHRWVGTAEEPADDPAIRLTLTEADPNAPAPAVAPVPAIEDDEPVEEPASEAVTEDDPAAGQEETDDTDDSGVSTEDTEDDPATVVTTAEETPVPWVTVAVVLLVLAVAGAVVARRRGRGRDAVRTGGR